MRRLQNRNLQNEKFMKYKLFIDKFLFTTRYDYQDIDNYDERDFWQILSLKTENNILLNYSINFEQLIKFESLKQGYVWFDLKNTSAKKKLRV